MKNCILLCLLLASSFVSWADINFISLNNCGDKTTVVFSITEDEKDSSNGININNIKLESNGRRYAATHVNANLEGNITVTAEFKKLNKFVNSSLKFNLNGRERCLDIQKEMQTHIISSSDESHNCICKPY